MQPPPLRTFLIDRHLIFLDLLKARLEQENCLIVGTASTGAEAMATAASRQSRLIILNAMMADCPGLTIVGQLKSQLPGAKFIVLSGFATNDFVLECMDAGVDALVSKALPLEYLITAIKEVRNNGTIFPSVTRNPSISLELTPREQLVAFHVAKGLTNKEIAQLLDRGVKTIDSQRMSLMRKLGVHNAAGICAFMAGRG